MFCLECCLQYTSCNWTIEERENVRRCRFQHAAAAAVIIIPLGPSIASLPLVDRVRGKEENGELKRTVHPNAELPSLEILPGRQGGEN